MGRQRQRRVQCRLPMDTAPVLRDDGSRLHNVQSEGRTGDTEEDFDLFENANMAVDPSMAPVLARMHSLVEKQWK